MIVLLCHSLGLTFFFSQLRYPPFLLTRCASWSGQDHRKRKLPFFNIICNRHHMCISSIRNLAICLAITPSPNSSLSSRLCMMPRLMETLSGHKRRLGLLGAKRTTITVHRSEEVLPQHAHHLTRQGTSVSSGEDGNNDNNDGNVDDEGSERCARRDGSSRSVTSTNGSGEKSLVAVDSLSTELPKQIRWILSSSLLSFCRSRGWLMLPQPSPLTLGSSVRRSSCCHSLSLSLSLSSIDVANSVVYKSH